MRHIITSVQDSITMHTVITPGSLIYIIILKMDIITIIADLLVHNNVVHCVHVYIYTMSCSHLSHDHDHSYLWLVPPMVLIMVAHSNWHYSHDNYVYGVMWHM